MSDLQAASRRVDETWKIRDDLMAQMLGYAKLHLDAVRNGDTDRAADRERKFLRCVSALDVARMDAADAWTGYLAAVDQELAKIAEARRV